MRTWSFAALLVAFACSSNPPASDVDAGSGPRDAASDVASPAEDAGTDGGPAKDGGGDGGSRDAGAYPHQYGDAGADAACELNRNCGRGLRCECANGDCFCKTGVRGEGRAGVDPCKDGNDCGSSICINDEWCSDECTGPGDCGPKTPSCKAVFGFSTKICAP